MPERKHHIFRSAGITTAILIFLVSLAPGVSPASKPPLVIKGGIIETITQGSIKNGMLLIENGRITAVGKEIAIPAKAEILDYSKFIIMPAVVSPDSNLGIYQAAPGGMDSATAFYTPAPSGKNNALYKVSHSVYPWHKDYELARRFGLVTSGISPPPAGIAGQGAVIRLGNALEAEKTFLKDPAFLKINYYTNSKFRKTFKAMLDEAKKVLDAQKKKDTNSDKGDMKSQKEKEAAETDAESLSDETQLFLSVLKGELPLIIECSASGLVHLLPLMEEYPGIRTSIRGQMDIYKSAALLKDSGIPLILEPMIESKSSFVNPYPERTNYVLKCQEMGLDICFQPPGNISEQIHFFDYLNLLTKLGVDKEIIMKGITIVPARVLGVESLCGSIEKGKFADLIIFRGDPFLTVPIIENVIIGGLPIQ